MSRVLVTGANGQLGSEIREHSADAEGEFFFTDVKSLDITDFSALGDFVKQKKIDTIINCAAYTAVDKAEKEEEKADLINHVGVENLAKIAKEEGIGLIHISTDYVFDGKNYKPYTEEDKPNPTGVYGKTKLAGEEAVLRISPKNSIIIRTSWVYSAYGQNFVKSMLFLGKTKEELGVVYDQIGAPTYAKELALVLLKIYPEIKNETPQIYHYSGEGVLSWFDFAKEIMKTAKLECKIKAIESSQYPTAAKRPHFSLLNKKKIKEKFDIEIPYWKDSLKECLKKLGEKR